MNLFNKMERQFKKQADNIAPDLKQQVKDELFQQGSESQAYGTSSVKVATKRNVWLIAGIFIAILIVMIPIILIQNRQTASSYSDNYLRVDINPSFEIISDENNMVKTVKPLNKEASIVIYGMNLTGLSTSQALDAIVKTTVKLGYLDKDFGAVKLVAVCADTSKEKVFIESVTPPQSITFPPTWLNESMNETSANQFDVSLGKFELMLEASQKSGETLEKLSKMTPNELTKIIKDYQDDELKRFDDELNSAYEKTDLSILNQTLKEIERRNNKIIEKIEDLLELVEDGEDNEQSVLRAISRFNILYPQFKFETDKFDIDEIEEHFESIIEQLEEEIDQAEERVEDALDGIKNIWKDMFEF